MADGGSKPSSLPRATARVSEALTAAGHPAEIRLLSERAHTAEEAAGALEVAPRQIVKSMVFRGKTRDRFILVLLPGDLRVDLERVAAELDEPVERANPHWVRERTGYAIGGIPPLGHTTEPTVMIDRRLLDEEVLWAAAGTPESVFRTEGTRLAAAVGGAVADVGRAAGDAS